MIARKYCHRVLSCHKYLKLGVTLAKQWILKCGVVSRHLLNRNPTARNPCSSYDELQAFQLTESMSQLYMPCMMNYVSIWKPITNRGHADGIWRIRLSMSDHGNRDWWYENKYKRLIYRCYQYRRWLHEKTRSLEAPPTPTTIKNNSTKAHQTRVMCNHELQSGKGTKTYGNDVNSGEEHCWWTLTLFGIYHST